VAYKFTRETTYDARHAAQSWPNAGTAQLCRHVLAHLQEERAVKKRTGTWLTLFLAIGLIAAATAYALSTNNPRWKVNGAALGSGGTHSVGASASGTQFLKASGLEIQCTGLSASAGFALAGSNAPNPGTAEGKITYSGCSVIGSEKCKINGAHPGSFETKGLAIELVYLTKTGAEKEEIATSTSAILVKPKEGTTVAELNLSPAGECPVSGVVTVSGKAGKTGILFNALAATANEELETHEIEAPTTALTTYFTNTGANTEEHTSEGIEAKGAPANYVGRIKVTVGSGSKYNLVLP
jgi:hypothetical protein